MKTIKLTKNQARISAIKTKENITTVDLEWGGPDDHQLSDFDIKKLGDVFSHGTNGNAGRTGWVVLHGDCKLSEGETIPLVKDL